MGRHLRSKQFAIGLVRKILHCTSPQQGKAGWVLLGVAEVVATASLPFSLLCGSYFAGIMSGVETRDDLMLVWCDVQ